LGKVKYTLDLMKFISLFESISHAKVKDCFEHSGMLVYIVNPHEIGKAVGKGGSTIKRVEQSLKKKVKVVEYSEDVKQFIRNAVAPVTVQDVSVEDEIVIITPKDHQTRGKLIGRDAAALKFTTMIVQRFFNEVKEMKVV
jgi:transcription termination/antitermination protein NusA